VASISPKANNWFMQAYREHAITRATAQGVLPEYAEICHVPLLPGSRWIDQNDIDQELPVAVLGPGVREELFGQEDWQGQDVMLTFSRNGGADTVVRRLAVIGALADEELASDEIYTSHRRVIFLPFTTWERFAPRGFQFFVMKPVTPDHRDQALAELRAVLAERHGFDPDNENTLLPYFDAIERARQIDQVFGGMRLFLSAVGVLILLLGALGVANVVLMSVTARTFEFGLRRALGCKRRWIFGQVFLEAALVCVASGAMGFGLGVLTVQVMGGMELPEGFARPQAEWQAAFLPGLLLLVVSLAAATWPAARAARLSVADTLQGGKL
jgi:putative ABC transport system permease protein